MSRHAIPQAGQPRCRSRPWAQAAAIGLLFLGAAFAAPGAAAGCIQVTVPGPVVLPDGSTQPAGSLSLCHEGAFNPVSDRHRLFVNGMPRGVFLSRTGRAESSDSQSFVTFLRRRDGAYVLVGYVQGRDGRSFLLREPAAPMTRGVEDPLQAWLSRRAIRGDTDTALSLLAAR